MAETITLAKRRKRRTSVNGKRNVLNVQGKDPKFEYRIINDVGDRIAMFEDNGWEVVTDTEIKIGERRIANPTSKGTVVSVSIGQGLTGVLMRIPKEYYEEDQKDKAASIAEMEKGIKERAKADSFYGKLDIK